MHHESNPLTLTRLLPLSAGFTLGGLAGDKFGTPAPFQITFCLLVLSTLFTRFCLPYIPPAASLPPTSTDTDSDEVASKPAPKESTFSFLHCLKVFLPQTHTDGRGGRFWGLTLLGTGCFMAVLATSYVVSAFAKHSTHLHSSDMLTHDPTRFATACHASAHSHQQLRLPAYRERIPVRLRLTPPTSRTYIALTQLPSTLALASS